MQRNFMVRLRKTFKNSIDHYRPRENEVPLGSRIFGDKHKSAKLTKTSAANFSVAWGSW